MLHDIAESTYPTRKCATFAAYRKQTFVHLHVGGNSGGYNKGQVRPFVGEASNGLKRKSLAHDVHEDIHRDDLSLLQRIRDSAYWFTHTQRRDASLCGLPAHACR